MSKDSKLIKQKEGALTFKIHGENKMVINWANNMVEIYHNGARKFVIDMNGEK